MKLTILGSGTAVPNGERNSAGYFVETSTVRMMLDCGAGTVHALSKYGVDWQRMTHLYISHFHLDHIGELAPLFFAFRHALSEARHEPLMLIAPRGIEKILAGLKSAFGEKNFTLKFPFNLQIAEPGETLVIGDGCKLDFEKTPHTEESLAVKITDQTRSISYTGDTAFSPELIPFFHETDLLISECSFQEPRQSPRHLAISEVAQMAQSASVKRLVVTHFYFSMSDDRLIKKLSEGYTGKIDIGRDGMQIVL